MWDNEGKRESEGYFLNRRYFSRRIDAEHKRFHIMEIVKAYAIYQQEVSVTADPFFFGNRFHGKKAIRQAEKADARYLQIELKNPAES